jgi:hypothetical protein
MPNVLVKDRETSLDIAVINSGSVEGIFELALLNNISLTKDLVSGEELIPCNILDDDAKNELISRGARPASSVDISEGEILEGIGYWRLQVDFIVQ